MKPDDPGRAALMPSDSPELLASVLLSASDAMPGVKAVLS